MVCGEGRQFSGVSDLQDAIMESWHTIDIKYSQVLYHSIPSRIVSVVKEVV